MGFIKEAKSVLLSDEAEKAAANGDVIFTPVLNMPQSHHGMSGNVRDWALMIASVEAAGWRLEQWTVGQDNKGRPEAYPLFRRI